MKKLHVSLLGYSVAAMVLAILAPGAVAESQVASSGTEAGAVIDGTIPAARPGLPQMGQRGALGPVRAAGTNRPITDPAIRDTHPLTANGLWETLSGNRVARPGGE